MEDVLEYLGVITGLLYLWLEIRQHKAMWIVGFVSSLAYVFVFFFSKFYAIMSLNAYYVVMSVYGFLLWSRRKDSGAAVEGEENEGIIYRHIKFPVVLGCALVAIGLFGLIYFVLNDFTDSPIAVGDGFVAALSIVATWILAQRIIEHWYCWIVANGVSVWLYYSQGLYPTMFLYFCYTVLSVVGFLNWKKKGRITA